jgi:hypothetical protein
VADSARWQQRSKVEAGTTSQGAATRRQDAVTAIKGLAGQNHGLHTFSNAPNT